MINFISKIKTVNSRFVNLSSKLKVKIKNQLGYFFSKKLMAEYTKFIKLNKNKHFFIPHFFDEYNELNGMTDLTRDIFRESKKDNFFYPFLKRDIKNYRNIIRYFSIYIKDNKHLNYELKSNFLLFDDYVNTLVKNLNTDNFENFESDIEIFKKSRSIGEIFIGNKNNNVEFFHHTSPIASGIFEWSIFVENVFTLFHPFLIQSKMKKLNLKKELFYHLIKEHLENKNCKKILVNYKQTQTDISEIFKSNIINEKTIFFKQGTKKIIQYDRKNYFYTKSEVFNKKIKFLFVNSFNGQDLNFYCRGGEYAINTFIEINKKYRNSELILRSPIPDNLKNKINNYSNIKVVNKWISKEKYVKLFKESHFLFSAGIGGFTETNLHCLMNGVILIGPDDFINNEKFEDRFIDIKSINQEILKYDASLKSFRYQENEKLFKYNYKIHNEVINKVLHFIDNKKHNNYIEILQKNYEFYEQNFKFEDMIKDVEPKIFN